MLRLLPGIDPLLVSTLPVHSSTFFENLSRVFVFSAANTGSCVVPQNEIGHPAHCYRRLMQVPVLSASGILLGSKACVIVFLS